MVELPNKKYATSRVYHVPWQKDTHSKENQVAVHAKLNEHYFFLLILNYPSINHSIHLIIYYK